MSVTVELPIPYFQHLTLPRLLLCNSRLEKFLNSVKVLEKYLISLLGLQKSLKF